MSETLSQAVAREIRAPHGTTLHCANWLIEAAYRMIQNNLDPDVAERPEDLVVYGGIGKAARNWECFEQILRSLRALQPDETLLIQSGSRSAFSAPTRMHPACCWRTPIWCRTGQPGITSMSWIKRA